MGAFEGRGKSQVQTRGDQSLKRCFDGELKLVSNTLGEVDYTRQDDGGSIIDGTVLRNTLAKPHVRQKTYSDFVQKGTLHIRCYSIGPKCL